MASDTRQRLIESATRRFYRDGFRNVGVDQLLADVGISKTAFYKHFESKEDLMLSVLEDQNRWVQQTFRERMRERGGSCPRRQLCALMDVVEMIADKEGFRGCIFVNVAIEFPLPHEPAHLAASRSKSELEEIICAVASEAGAGQPRALAQELCLIMEGAWVARHVSGNPHTVAIARRVADRVIDRYLPSDQSVALSSGQQRSTEEGRLVPSRIP